MINENVKALLMSNSTVKFLDTKINGWCASYEIPIARFLGSDFYDGSKNVLVLPHARAGGRTQEAYGEKMAGILNESFGISAVSITDFTPFNKRIDALMNADAVIGLGGNTFNLISDIKDSREFDILKERVHNGSLKYMGISAGANFAGKLMSPTNDDNWSGASDLYGLDLMDGVSIKPHFQHRAMHYLDDEGIFRPHCGETMHDRIEEGLIINKLESTKVIGLPVGSYLLIQNGRVIYDGYGPGSNYPEVEPVRVYSFDGEKVTFQSVKKGGDITGLLE